MGEGRRPLEDVAYAEPVAIDFYLTSKGEKFRLTGSFKANLKCNCSRCLSIFDNEVSEEIDLVFVPRDVMAVKEEVELDKNDLNVAAYIDSIDLRQVIDEQVILALPMKLICSDDCSGDLVGDSDSKEVGDEIDERLVVLKDIKERLLKKNESQ
ncbi:MAG: DUF177 domain-containing protein [Chlorobiales bacterium]|nr:DUF177 domain-containing protein [Chlorobiales bacterium]